MNPDQVGALREKLGQLGRMQANLAYSHGKVTEWWMPELVFSEISPEQRLHLSAFKADFSELQDHLGAAMKLIALIEEENTLQFTYVLNYMEQLGVLPDMASWMDVRRLRNHAAHDYSASDEEKKLHFQNLLAQVAFLKEILAAIEQFVEHHYLNRKWQS